MQISQLELDDGYDLDDAPFTAVRIRVLEPSSCRRIAGGMLNGQPVDEAHDTVEVYAGETLAGTVEVRTNNTMSAAAVAPLGATVNWGERTTQHWTANGWIGTGVNDYTVDVDVIAPATAGDFEACCRASESLRLIPGGVDCSTVPDSTTVLAGPPSVSADGRLVSVTAAVDGLLLGGARTALELLAALV